MAITISGENNNDRILAQDGVIDEISGINIVGLLTAGHINVGNNIQLGNAGVATATTFNGNLTGNVNNTTLLLQTGGYERVRIDSSGNVIVNNNTAAAGSYTYKLLVSDNISSSEQTFGIQYPGVVTYGLNAESNSDFTIKKDGTERARIKSDGKFGIGDFSSGTAVSQALHVKGSAPAIFLEHTGGYDMTLTTSDGMGMNGITVNGGFLSLAYNNKNIVMCRTGGNVGIHSTAPHRKLVVGGINDGDMSVIGANAGIYFGTHPTGGFQSNAGISRAGSNNYHIGGSTPGDLCIASESGAAMIFGVSPFAGGMNTFLHVSRLRNFNFYGADYKFHIGTNEKLRIDSNGIVDVIGGVLKFASGASTRVMYRSGDNDMIYEAAANFFYQQKIADTSHRWYTNGADVKMMIDGSGRVMIGTTTEGLATYGEELTLGSSDHAGMTIRSGNGHKGTIYFSDATSGAAEYIGSLQYDHSDNSMRFRIDGTDTLFINSSNNLKVPDNSELQFGGSLNSGDGDLRLYHTSNNSYVHGKTGLLQMKNEGGNIDLMAWSSLLLRVNAGEMAIDCNHNGSVDLYHNNEIRARTDANGFYLERVNTFSNPNNTGSETKGAMIDIGGNIHLQEVHPTGAYTDRCDLVINTNSGYGQGLSDKIRITAGGRIVIYSSVNRSYNKGWAPGNLVLHNNNNDLTVDFTQGILFTDNANNDTAGGWMHGGIVCTGSTGYNGNMCFGIDGNGASNNNISGITERMRLVHNGTLRIKCQDMSADPGSSNKGVMIGDSSTGSVFSNGSATGFANNIIFMNGNGVVGKIETNGSNTNYNQSSSDRTLKKNFENWTEEVLPIFKNLNPQKFNFLPEDDSVEKTKGFIAQDLTEHFPRAYPLDPLTGKYNYNPGGMVVYLMKALQEEIVKREGIEAKYNDLEARIAALEGS